MRRCLQALDDHVRLGEALIAVVRQRRTPPAPVLGQPVTRWRVAFAHGTAFASGVRVGRARPVNAGAVLALVGEVVVLATFLIRVLK